MSTEVPTSTLDFESARDDAGDPWTRADPSAALIERKSLFGWFVTLPDGDDAHTVTLARDGDDYRGWCDCDGYQYHGVCAHLCTLRKADFLGDVLDANDQRVSVVSVEEEFGRPEGRL